MNLQRKIPLLLYTITQEEGLMGKRRMINFTKAGFPQYEEVEEEGMAKLCAMGIPWVNVDTLSTLARRGIRRTCPKGEPLEEQNLQTKTS